MRRLPSSSAEYLEELKKRSLESKIYTPYQLTGLEIANILEDWAHKSLYIRLAKERGGAEVLRIAKEVAEKDGIKNKGAYFMKVLQNQNHAARPTNKKKS